MILIDRREGSKILLDMPALEGHCEPTLLDFEVDGKMVACGDVMLTGHGPQGSTLRVGVEVKKMSDLLTSISSGRLGGTQIPRMVKVFDAIFVLYHGVYRVGPSNHLQVQRWKNNRPQWESFRIGRNPVPWSYLEGFILTAQLKTMLDAGKPLIFKHVYDEHEAACWLRTLDHWLEKDWEKHRGLAVFDKSRELSPMPNADPVEEQIARTAASLPAIDWVRGWAAARHFDSIIDMMGASIQQWQSVKGIGPVIARSAREAIWRRKESGRPRKVSRGR